MRILFYTAIVQTTAPGWYRIELPCRALGASGHTTFLTTDVRSSPTTGNLEGWSDNEIFESADVVVLQGLIPAEEIWQAREAGQVVICDLGDLPVLPETHFQAESVRATLREAEDQWLACDALTVSTPHLKRWLHSNLRSCPPIHVVRNAIHCGWGEPQNVEDGPVLGWLGSAFERADDLSVLRPWLGDFLEEHDLQFVHVGDAPGLPSFAELADVSPERMEYRPSYSFLDYTAARPWAGIDIQLVPLMDAPFSRAKTCLKGMESAAMGIPFVASPQDEYKWFGCGRLAGSDLANQGPKLWIAALEAMLDSAERLRMASEARERVAHEDIRVRWMDWEQVYKQVLGQ